MHEKKQFVSTGLKLLWIQNL